MTHGARVSGRWTSNVGVAGTTSNKSSCNKTWQGAVRRLVASTFPHNQTSTLKNILAASHETLKNRNSDIGTGGTNNKCRWKILRKIKSKNKKIWNFWECDGSFPDDGQLPVWRTTGNGSCTLVTSIFGTLRTFYTNQCPISFLK
jgi:hypothetical protein